MLTTEKTTPNPKVNKGIWFLYKKTKSQEIRNKILMQHMDIITTNAKKMYSVYRSKADYEDIVNQGVFALMDSIEKYDPDLGIQFDTFASIRVRGSIIDYVRKQDWVPRTLRKKVKDIEEAYGKFYEIHQRSGSDEEIAEMLQIDVADLLQTLQKSNGMAVLSFEELLQDGLEFTSKSDTLFTGPSDALQAEEMKQEVAKAIDGLKEKERLVVSLYYFEELKLKEIAEVLSLTESRVSQIHSQAIIKLRVVISKYLGND